MQEVYLASIIDSIPVQQSAIIMTPEESQRLEACIQEAAAILYRNTPKSELKPLESIEKTVREQILQHVSPKIALFLSAKSPEPRVAESEN